MSARAEQPHENKPQSKSSAPGHGQTDANATTSKKFPPLPSELPFHYHREERLALPSAPAQKASLTKKKRFFTKTSLLLIIIIDILLLAIIFFNKSGNRQAADNNSYKREQGGYSFILNGLQLKDRLIASLSIKKIKAQTEVTGLIYVRFSGKKETELSSAVLPDGLDQEQELTATLFGENDTGFVKAEITLGKEVLMLNRKISNE